MDEDLSARESTFSVHIPYEIINYNLADPKRPITVSATQAELDKFAQDGFLYRKQLFDLATVNVLKEATDELTSIEMSDERREYYPGNGLFIRYLIHKHPSFLPLLKCRDIMTVVRAMLGPQIQLMDLVARVTFLDDQDQKLMWHIHNRVVPHPMPPFFSHPHSVDALIYLDDANEENGALCVIPGSHLEPHRRMNFRDHSDKQNQLIVPVKAGDCIFSHSNLWHRVVPSSGITPGGRRRVLLMGFMPSWFKKDFPKGIRPDSTQIGENSFDHDPDLKELMGHFEWI